MPAPDDATIRALRSDLALQLARFMRRAGLNQVTAAKRFAVPQPTLSKIVNGRVADLSLELLIRIAVRAGLPLALQTGLAPEEAGVFVSGGRTPALARTKSRLSDVARSSLSERTRLLSPEQRLAEWFEHTRLVNALHRAGQTVGSARVRKARSR